MEAKFVGLVPGRAYNISIQTKSASSVSQSKIVTYRTMPLTPKNVKVNNDSITPSKFRIDWEAPDNTEFDGYEVTIHSDSEFFELYQQYVSKTGDLLYSIGMRKNVEPGQTYQVTVRTVSGNITSWPERINVTTKPLPVENLQLFADDTTGRVIVLWEPHLVSVQDEYKITYHEVQIEHLNIISLNTNQTYYVFESLLPDKKYTLSVQAVSKGIESDESTIYIITPPSIE